MIIKPYRPLILPLVLVSLFGMLAFSFSDLSGIDRFVTSFVQATPDIIGSFFAASTHLGDHWVLVAIALAVAAWEFYRKRPVRSLVMALSLLAMPFFYLIKQTVERSRPASEFVTQHGLHDYSFPSGHAAGSAAIYGMIAILAYSHIKGTWKYVVSSLCVFLIILIGVSRIYIGAHFPTDVLAGWLMALIVLSLLRSLSLYLAKRSDQPNREAIKDTTEEPDHLS